MHPLHSDVAAVASVRRLRGQLRELLADLRVWVDLLRHKAHALRAVPAGPACPHDLGRALAAGGPTRPSPAMPQSPRAVGDDTDDLLTQAKTVWETVGDPWDEQARRELADTADRLADRLEHRWQDARAELRSSADELVRMLTDAKREAGQRDR
jgi:hypothetical protein